MHTNATKILRKGPSSINIQCIRLLLKFDRRNLRTRFFVVLSCILLLGLVEIELLRVDHSIARHAYTVSRCLTSDEIMHGEWRRRQRLGEYPHGGLARQDQCPWNKERNCMERNDTELERVVRSMSWEWRPSKCVLNAFDPVRFGNMLQSRRILFVGDSLNTDMKNSMECMLGSRHASLVAVREDLLGCSKNTCTIDEALNSWGKILGKLNATENDVLVLNAGAHWHGSLESAATVFGNVSVAVAQLFPGTVVFRTTVMGHESCEHYEEPTRGPPTTPSLYNWRSFASLNHVINDAFEQLLQGRYLLLNVSMFESRGDGHDLTNGDCLHYCVPGPINEWNRLLYHLLVEHWIRL